MVPVTGIPLLVKPENRTRSTSQTLARVTVTSGAVLERQPVFVWSVAESTVEHNSAQGF